MESNIQEKINEQAKNSQDNMLWGKPANDILNGRDNSASAPPIRAIWEMIQNARDVSENECNIYFTRKESTFEFKHDGLPFTNDTLNALILQTSAKSRNDGDQVGQYGTGFLTTHKFGREFHLAGSLKLVNDEDVYYNFPYLKIDRTPNTREEMVASLAIQFGDKKKWLEDNTHRSSTPEKWTVFTYLQPNEIERKNVEEAFKKAPELIPYVLCLNEGIKTITFNDEIEDSTVTYKRGVKTIMEETSMAILYSTDITIEDSVNGKSEIIKMQTLESKKTVTTKKGINKTMVTVILPVCDKVVYQPSLNIARLFIFLPLVGTENFGINFIFHAPKFTCLTDDRSDLRLITDGQTENDPSIENREYIKEATTIVFDYIERHIAEWENVHFLAPIDFDVTNANKDLSSYYKELKNEWLQKMSNLDIVDVKTEERVVRKKTSEIFVLDESLSKAIDENKELLTPFYNVLSNMKKESVPIPEQLIFWSDTFANWYKDEICAQILDIGKIVDYIADQDMSVVSEEDLLIICKYLCDSDKVKEDYFTKKILLTEDNTLTNRTEGRKCGPFCDKLKDCIKVLLPEVSSRFVKEDFADLIELTLFGNGDLKTALSLCTETLQTEIKKVTDVAFSLWDTNKTIPESSEGILTDTQRNALMDYCYMVIPRNSNSFQAKALELVREYYNYNFDFDDTIDTNFFEWRGAIRTLLNNVLTEFTILSDDEKKERTDWVKRTIACIYSFSDFNGMLQNYRVYLTQSGEFCYCKELKKDSGIPEKMKDIYNIIMSTPTSKKEIRSNLFDSEFGKFAITDATYEVVVFGKDIMTKILESGKYANEVDTYEHKDLIMDIINNFDDEEYGATWKSAFGTINNDIPTLLSKLVLNKDNREPMIKIMKVKDKERLNKAAEIIDDENLIGIWDLGKAVWIEKQNEQHDFEKKKELGNYVEDYLRSELKDILAEYKIEVKVDDVQGGQDIIIYINDNPIYYIEVKSRWISADSVMMSALQLERSVEKKECYSLFAVDMVGFNGEDVKEHIYPETIAEFLDRIRVVANIGELNEEIIPTNRDATEQVHIGGDYKAIVPQKLISSQHISFNSFIDEVLKPKVIEEINKMQ